MDNGLIARDALAMVARYADASDDDPRAVMLTIVTIMGAMACCITTPFAHRGAAADLMAQGIRQGLDVYGTTDLEDSA